MTLPDQATISPPARAAPEAPRARGARWGLLVFSILIFMLSLFLVKEGAGPLGPVIRKAFSNDSPLGALGFGWIFAIVALSGSPVAATALAFFQGGVTSEIETFAMIAGSRLGAAFVVLFIGFVYTLRTRTTESSLGSGLLSLLVTQSVHLPAVALGYFVLTGGWLAGIGLNTNSEFVSPLDILFEPVVLAVGKVLPLWGLFPIGFGLMLVSFWTFDQALPDFHLESTSLGQFNRLLYRPVISFAMGAVLTAFTMSVSVSLGLLVPLSARGYIRQENAIPYIMGANITTFVDTLVAGALLANPLAVTIVLVQMISVTLVSLVLLVTSFTYFERAIVWVTRGLLSNRWYLAAYVLATIGVPIALVLIF